MSGNQPSSPVTIHQSPVIQGNLNIACAMMATEMERHGGFEKVLSRPAVVEAVHAAREYMALVLGIDLKNPPLKPDGAS